MCHNQKILLLILVGLSCLFLFPDRLFAADFTVERAIQHDLILSRSILLSIEARQEAGQEVTTQIARLKALAESIRANHERLVERFAARDEVTANIGETAESRQQEMVDGYMMFVDDYLVTIGYLPDDAVSRSDIMLLKAHFEQILPKRTLPLLGTLPYRHLLQAPKSPLIEPAVVPAYQGGAERAVTEADLTASPESPITLEIAQLAESLHWSPLEI
ncbi:MAG: hypothetical protein KJ950_16345, partial [Proteobacteria bacterium]|nr:hypothetical protein [Pseudomonadota bacterium]